MIMTLDTSSLRKIIQRGTESEDEDDAADDKGADTPGLCSESFAFADPRHVCNDVPVV